MKIKLAIIYGILIWIISTILIEIINPIFNLNFPNINIIIPIISIFVTIFFTIVYIRNIDDNEVIEGILVGIVFVIIDIALDNLFYILPNTPKLFIGDYPIHILYTAIITIFITTFLGYLAQMNIDLK